MQKPVRGAGLREAMPVAAGMGDGGLAQTRETAAGEMASRFQAASRGVGRKKGLTEAAYRWKASWAEETVRLHGLAVEPVLARWIARLPRTSGRQGRRSSALLELAGGQ